MIYRVYSITIERALPNCTISRVANIELVPMKRQAIRAHQHPIQESCDSGSVLQVGPSHSWVPTPLRPVDETEEQKIFNTRLKYWDFTGIMGHFNDFNCGAFY